MPFLFLSPSTQYFNPYITTGDERYWMNALADEMTPYLHASGITVTRNDPDGSAFFALYDPGHGWFHSISRIIYCIASNSFMSNSYGITNSADCKQ